MKADLFQSCGYCWIFQICWHIEFNTFTASSFRIWNSSTGIPSPPLTLFVVMLPKAHLTSHSKMSGYKWVITPFWLSGSWRSFFCIVHLMFSPPYSVSSWLENTCKIWARWLECHILNFLFIKMWGDNEIIVLLWITKF